MFERIEALICDMDGVLWRGSVPLPGLTELFDFFRAREIKFALATNNSRNTQADYVKKLADMGVNGVQPHHIITSGTATLSYLKTQYPPGTRLFVIGGDGLKRTLGDAGYKLAEDGAEVVVCGLDFDFTYEKARAATFLIRAGARFIGTNPDSSFPTPEGLAPGAGSLLALIAAASGAEPTVIGKPGRGMFDAALQQLGARPGATLMVGDRINTDIMGAQALGIKTALVMTGVETEESLRSSEVQPDAVFEGLPELIEALPG